MNPPPAIGGWFGIIPKPACCWNGAPIGDAPNGFPTVFGGGVVKPDGIPNGFAAGFIVGTAGAILGGGTLKF